MSRRISYHRSRCWLGPLVARLRAAPCALATLLCLVACGETPLQPGESRPAARATDATGYKAAVNQQASRQGVQEDLDEAIVGTWWSVIGSWSAVNEVGTIARTEDDSLTRWDDRRVRWEFGPVHDGSGEYLLQYYAWPAPEDAPEVSSRTDGWGQIRVSAVPYEAYVEPPASTAGMDLQWQQSGVWRLGEDGTTLILMYRKSSGEPVIWNLEENVVIEGVWRGSSPYRRSRYQDPYLYYEPGG